MLEENSANAMFKFLIRNEISASNNLFNLEYEDEFLLKNLLKIFIYFHNKENSIDTLNNLSTFRFGTVKFDQKINVLFFIIYTQSNLNNIINDFKYLVKTIFNNYYVYKINFNAKCRSSLISKIIKQIKINY
ncbi:hypothetical protein HERIO_335 [Hepatospora eriocheir]|uniref:Uncharacterized protein n=1 Tax=Hepatospora eriocheir TaxID=1081669 RepID=A0A1X0QDC6_9MICR|nr:hypothetical protein HERIO_335 [Hepatospora eriocheir]